MITKFNVKQKVWIVFNNKPKLSIIKKISITDFIEYHFSEPFEDGLESDSGICSDVIRLENEVGETKEELVFLLFK